MNAIAGGVTIEGLIFKNASRPECHLPPKKSPCGKTVYGVLGLPEDLNVEYFPR